MKIRRFAAWMLTTLMLIALPMTATLAAHRSDAEAAIAAAKAVNGKAAGAGIDTTDTAGLIKEAEGLLPSRQYTKAIEVAGKAQKQDEYALSQTAAAPAGGEESPAKVEAEAAIAAADAARKKAASVGGEWRDTGKMIKKAEAAMKSGEFDQAIKLATKAEHQGELGYAQAMEETDAGFPSYMHAKQ